MCPSVSPSSAVLVDSHVAARARVFGAILSVGDIDGEGISDIFSDEDEIFFMHMSEISSRRCSLPRSHIGVHLTIAIIRMPLQPTWAP